MKKILFSLLTVALALTGCATFDDPKTESYGDGPAVSINVTATADDEFTFVVTPGDGTQYYSFLVSEDNEAQELDAATLLKSGYDGVSKKVVKATGTSADTYQVTDIKPFTTYYIYAVAANDKGITGSVAVASVTTSDGDAPVVEDAEGDGAAKTASVLFSEEVLRGDGAITAIYYKEWDFGNPVTLTEDEFTVTVSGNTATFSAPDVPAGAYVFFSWEAGAFTDAKGNKCGSQDSGFNMTDGSLVGVYIEVAKEAFAIEDSNFTAPAVGNVFPKWDEFEGELTFDFDIFRNDYTAEDGDISVVYSSAKKTVTYKLSTDEWSVSGTKLTFKLPAAPSAGDIVTVKIVEGAINDVYGNPNAAYESDKVWWKYFAMTKDMVLGTFTLAYVSASDDEGTVNDGGTVTITEDASVANGLIIKNLFYDDTEVSATYNIETGKLYINDDQYMGVESWNGYELDIFLYNVNDAAPVAFSVNADGTITLDEAAGIGLYAYLGDNGLGWWEKFATLTFTKVSSAAKARLSVARKSTATAAKKAPRLSKKARKTAKRVK